MPYKTIEEAEKKNTGLKKYSEKAKRGWLKSLNSCFKDGGDDNKCFAIAYSTANKVDNKKGAKMSNEWMTIADMEKVCPSCADKMRSRRISKVRTEIAQNIINKRKKKSSEIIARELLKISALIQNPNEMLVDEHQDKFVEISFDEYRGSEEGFDWNGFDREVGKIAKKLGGELVSSNAKNGRWVTISALPDQSTAIKFISIVSRLPMFKIVKRDKSFKTKMKIG